MQGSFPLAYFGGSSVLDINQIETGFFPLQPAAKLWISSPPDPLSKGRLAILDYKRWRCFFLPENRQTEISIRRGGSVRTSASDKSQQDDKQTHTNTHTQAHISSFSLQLTLCLHTAVKTSTAITWQRCQYTRRTAQRLYSGRGGEKVIFRF